MIRQPVHRGPKDPVLVDLSDPDEVRYWTAELDCSRSELDSAVGAVGRLVERVRHYFTRQKPPANDPTV